VLVRRLGQPESSAVAYTLGLAYHLDDYLDDDAARFAAEFPQVYQVGVGWVCRE
jgi:hypothetical protein